MERHHPRGNWRHRGDDDSERGQERRLVQGRGRGRGRAAEHDPNCFPVLNASRYEREAPLLPPPTVLGSFSVDKEKNIIFNNSMMPKLCEMYIPDGEFMEVDIDLKKGWERGNYGTGRSGEGIGRRLQWILRNQEKLKAEDSPDRLAADFVCSNSMLKKFMLAPYAQHPKNFNAQWKIYAKYFKGTIYMTKENLDQKKHSKGVCQEEGANQEEGAIQEGARYGHRFEQYMTGGDPNGVLEGDCQFQCVLQLDLNGKSLLLSAHIDAADPTRHQEDFRDMNSFVRLKARKDSTKQHADNIYRRYVLNEWWIENKITGVPRLLVGKRNADEVVYTLQMLQTDDMPDLAQGMWEPSVCINFLDEFLNFVKEKVVAEPDVVHRFEKSAELRKILHSSSPNLEDFLPDWYKEQLFAT